MKRIRYTKFTGDLSSSFGLEDLMQALSDFLLDSGFQDPMSRFQEFDGDQTMENLREAIRQALDSGEIFDDEAQEQVIEDIAPIEGLCLLRNNERAAGWGLGEGPLVKYLEHGFTLIGKWDEYELLRREGPYKGSL